MKSLVFMVVLGLVVSTQGQSCHTPFEAVGGRCLYVDMLAPLGWQDARKYCGTLGGDSGAADLVIFPTCDDFTIFAGYLGFIVPADTRFWVGAHTEFSSNNWRWVDGEVLSSGVPYWAYKEGHDDGQDCAALNSASYFQLADYPCDEQLYFVCAAPDARSGQRSERDDPVIPPTLNCPDESVQLGEFCYWFSSSQKSWAGSEDYCRTKFDSNRGELFSPASCDEFTKMAHHLEVAERDKSHWSGAADVSGYQEWFWNNGDPVPAGPPFWATDMPQDHQLAGTHDYCGLMSAAKRFYLEDDRCSALHYYICKLHVVVE